MAIRLSQGVVNNNAHGMGWGEIIRGATCVVYSGSQPTTAEAPATAGTELVRFTLNKLALTAEKRAGCKLTFAGTSGSIDSIKVGGVELLSAAITSVTSATDAATRVITAINSNATNPDYYATLGGTIGSSTDYAAGTGVVWIIAPKNTGTLYNGATTVPVVTASTTATAAINSGSAGTTASGYFNDTGGVAGVATANGLVMSCPAVAGLISAVGTWQGTATTTGTAGWFRILCTPQLDTGIIALATTGDEAYLPMRIDGTVGVSGADMLVSSTTVTAGVDQTTTSFSLTVPSL